MGKVSYLKSLLAVLILFLQLVPDSTSINAQVYNYFYRISFKDKGNYNTSTFQAIELLSDRAIERRIKAGIIYPDFHDLPVNRDYISQVTNLGYKMHTTSKWQNTALFKTTAPADTSLLRGLPFVREIKIVRKPAAKNVISDKLEFTAETADIPPYNNPISMLNGYSLHNSGFNGKGILIAVLDGGFDRAQLIPSLNHLRARNGIKGSFDFVNLSNNVYGFHYHGTAVLSVLAGMYINQIEGTAPGADYWLLRTEDTASEFPVEEDFWAAGAEFADSIGADIISSSLGYYEFDDPAMNYKFSDMNGNGTFVTRAADLAASKGILVVASAGNERNKSWLRIIAPSDGDSVLCAGAVDGYNVISTFSSAGPSFDRRIKPDNVAQGVSVPVQIIESTIVRSNGTSFSCPVISGMCASLMQAVPEALNTDIIKALHESANRFNNPDSLYGYGLPDMTKALSALEEKYINIPEVPFSIGPNPFTGVFQVTFRDSPEFLGIDIYSSSGRLIARREYKSFVSRTVLVTELMDQDEGLYIIRLRTGGNIYSAKLIKLDR